MLAGMRLLATDLDGTLVFHHAVGQADAEALVRWREAGNLLVMNTGRSISALRSALDGFDVDYDYAVLYTGAVLTDGRAGVIEARTLPDGLIEEVLDVLGREERITIFATTLAGDLQLHDTLGSGTDLLTLFRRGTTADLAGRAVVGGGHERGRAGQHGDCRRLVAALSRAGDDGAGRGDEPPLGVDEHRPHEIGAGGARETERLGRGPERVRGRRPGVQVGGAHGVAIHLGIVPRGDIQRGHQRPGQHAPVGIHGVDGLSARQRVGVRQQAGKGVVEGKQCRHGARGRQECRKAGHQARWPRNRPGPG